MGQFAKLCRPNSQFVPIAGVSGGTFPAKDSLRVTMFHEVMGSLLGDASECQPVTRIGSEQLGVPGTVVLGISYPGTLSVGPQAESYQETNTRNISH